MRYLILDRITMLKPGEIAIGVKCISLSEDIFEDHFPGHPIMPGALIIEAMAQLAGVLVEATARNNGHHNLHALLVGIDNAKFRRLVRPGDKMELEAKPITVTEDGGVVQCVAQVDGQIVATSELKFALTQVTNAGVIKRRKEVLNIWLTGSAENHLENQ